MCSSGNSLRLILLQSLYSGRALWAEEVFQAENMATSCQLVYILSACVKYFKFCFWFVLLS